MEGGTVKRLLIFIFVLAVAVVGIGFWRGWFTFSTEKTADNKTEVKLTVDKDKLSADEKGGLKKLQSVEQTLKDKIAGTKEKAEGAAGQAVPAADKESKEAGIVPAVAPKK